jgi:ferredoxin
MPTPDYLHFFIDPNRCIGCQACVQACTECDTHRGESMIHLELVPRERIRWTDKFDDPNLPGEMKMTASFRKVSVGTEVNIVQEGLPDVIPPEACVLGWQESLTLLAKLVEAEIPD